MVWGNNNETLFTQKFLQRTMLSVFIGNVKIKSIWAYLVYFQPIIYAFRMVGMFAGKQGQRFTILIVQPANDTTETGAHKIHYSKTGI